jgi:hypothetical protein
MQLDHRHYERLHGRERPPLQVLAP